ncbi:MAG: ligand-binding sensor domain-containing protein/signal transduction histidine kinase [Phenylobacterium sp.]|jgi:ligand-binding sensor domain-containing protein/signal transduction histidine kinase
MTSTDCRHFTLRFNATAFALILLLMCFCCHANELRFERLTTEQGLSQMSVNDILQDREGFIWFATQDGLNRYDGYQFKVYKTIDNDPWSLASNWCHMLLEDSQGRLWIGTENGLHQYDRQLDRFIRYNHDPDDDQSIGGNIVMSIDEDRDGYLWMSVFERGLNRLDPSTGSFMRYLNDPDNSESLSSNRVISVLLDQRDTLWVGTHGGGLNRFNRHVNQFERFLHQPDDTTSLSDNFIRTLYADTDNTLWIGTVNTGVNRFNPETETFSRYWLDENHKTTADPIAVEEIYQDNDKNHWFGTSHHGIYRQSAQNGLISHLFHDPIDAHSLSNNDIAAITQDRSGLLWIGSMGGGVNKYNPATARFKHYKHRPSAPNGLQDNNIWALHQDKSKSIWIGSNTKGLSRLDPTTNTFTHYKHDPENPNSLSENSLQSIYSDHDNVIWVGTNTQGLNRLNPGETTFSHFVHDPNNPDSLSHNIRMVAITEDHAHNLWIATGLGLNRLDPTRRHFTRYLYNPSTPDGISSNIIQSLLTDHDGRMWIGHFNRGLDWFDPASGKFTNFSHEPDNDNSLSSNTILSIYQSPDGILWLGTFAGINKFDPKTKTFSRYRQRHGLSNETVMGIMADKAGNLWLTTNNGLNRFDPRSETFDVYHFNDGLQHSEFNMGAYFSTPSDQMLVGGINGFNTFYPQQIVKASTAPIIAFTDFLLNNQAVAISPHSAENSASTGLQRSINHTSSMVLTHTSSMFSIEFAALHFTNPQQNRYAWQLEGFDQHWINAAALNRRATYTNLDAGEYVFKVKGSNNDNVWSSQPRTIKITILPAPWRTWWAYSLYAIVLMSLAAVIAWLRFKKLAAERQAATMIVASEQQLSLALWGSRDQLWDWNKKRALIERRNILKHFDLPVSQPLVELHGLAAFIHPEDQNRFDHALAQHCQGEQDYFECSYRMRDNQNQWRWVLDRGKIVERDEHHEAQRIVGTLQDIDNMHQAKQALRELNDTLEQKVEHRTKALQDSIDQLTAAQQQLVEAEKMASLGNLVSGVAHEVNTPLGICITMVSMLMEKVSNLEQQINAGTMSRKVMNNYIAETKQAQALVDNNLHRAAELIQSFKKVAVDQTEDSFDNIHFHDYLQDIIRSMEPRLNKHQIAITLASTGDWSVQTWPGAWWQILSNLTENTLSHGFLRPRPNQPGGQITISAQLTHSQNNQSVLRFHYHDNGCGMDEETLEKIYEPFFTNARNRGHAGLGMHIVYNLVVQKFAGSISGQSTVDGGVEFVIEVVV